MTPTKLKMEFLSMGYVTPRPTEMQRRPMNRLVHIGLIGLILFGTSDRVVAVVPRGASDESAAENAIDLSSAAAHESRATHFSYTIRISGTLRTPAKDGEAPWDLASTAAFEFDQQRYASDANGSRSLRAARRFRVAETNSTIGKDHRNQISLPEQSRLIYLYGTELSLTQISPDVRLTREQVDLLQFPCDPLIALGLLPDRKLASRTEKWNAAPWVVPMLTGIETPVRQEATCSLKSIDAMTAVIDFRCSSAGAVTGSSTEVEVTGQMTFDRGLREIRDLKATLKEKRKAGTVSPGLDVVAEIAWMQTEAAGADLPASIPAAEPDARQQLLTLVTPWRILMLHDRNWFVFHETNDLVMLRMLHQGALVAQCNISSAPLLAPGSFTPEDKFLQEVEKAVIERGGVITGSDVIPDRNGWRIQRVRARGEANQKELLWDYYLCGAANGEQISLVFSHAAEDARIFEGKADQFLNSLTTRSSRPKIALPR
ncbi:MAG: hypothetical protein ACK58L_21740 [Planctomycetota bacterium]